MVKKKRYHQKFLAVCRYENPSRTCPLREWESHIVIIPLEQPYQSDPDIGHQRCRASSRSSPGLGIKNEAGGTSLPSFFSSLPSSSGSGGGLPARPARMSARPERLFAQSVCLPKGLPRSCRDSLTGNAPLLFAIAMCWFPSAAGGACPLPMPPFPFPSGGYHNKMSLFALPFSSTSAGDPRARFRGQRAGKRLSVLGKPIFPAG